MTVKELLEKTEPKNDLCLCSIENYQRIVLALHGALQKTVHIVEYYAVHRGKLAMEFLSKDMEVK